MNRGIYNSGIYPDGGIYKVSESGVNIDGKSYKTKKIGNLVWTIENLSVETTNSESKSDHPDFGNYYIYSDLAEIESKLSNGWRIPSISDFENLVSECNSSAVAAQSTGYSVWPNATNSSKFSAVPSRISSTSGSGFDRSILWSSFLNFKSGQEYECLIINANSFSFPTFSTSDGLKTCARACKSASPRNLFNKTTASLLAGYCGTSGANFIINANGSTQRSLIIPITDEMKGKYLRFSCDNGDDVANRWVCGQVDTIPSSGQTTYGSENTLFVASIKQVGKRSFTDSIRKIGDYNYIVFFFDSGLSDTSKFIDSLMICDDGNYYPYVSGN